MAERQRVVVVQTHPVQYLAPWFRWIAEHAPSIDLTVLYAVEPTARAQAAGFGGQFVWELPLRQGYANRVLSPEPYDQSLDAATFSNVDAVDLEDALGAIGPHAVVVPGWHAAVYRRALDVCDKRGWPAIYRGDSTLASGRHGIPAWVRGLATRARLKRFDAYLAVGTRSREYLRAHGAPDPLIFTSPHAVDSGFFERAAATRCSAERAMLTARFGLDPAKRVILFAGKLQPQKRPLDALHAVSRMQRPAQLLVVGRGPLDAECQAVARRLKVSCAFAGFLQPHEMVEAYAASDVMVLPSAGETWGLVVNEALAGGLPCVVSDMVGCHPDLVSDDNGGVYPAGDVTALAATLDTVCGRLDEGHSFAAAGAARAATHSFQEATAGLELALRRLGCRARADRPASATRRVVACCGSMTSAGGLERMTFEVLRLARERGAHVHCIVNTWGSSGIVDMADEIGASWSTGFYWYPMQRRLWRPTVAARVFSDVLRTSAGLLRDAWRQRPTVVLLPDYTVVLRNLPALLPLRLIGIRIVHRLGTAPDVGAGYRRMWRWCIAPVSHTLVCNSAFTARELAACGVPAEKIAVAPNVLPVGRRTERVSHPIPGRIVYAGQIIPGKGVHLLIDAVALLVARGHDVSLDIVGDMGGWESPTWAGYQADLRARARHRSLKGRVRFLGWRDDVPLAMAEAWLHAAPSLPEIREAFGIVVLEAKSAGVPSIVGSSGALPDLVTHQVDGWVATQPTAEAFAEGLAWFLDADRRAGASVAARASLTPDSPLAFAAAWDAAFAWDGVLDSPMESGTCP